MKILKLLLLLLLLQACGPSKIRITLLDKTPPDIYASNISINLNDTWTEDVSVMDNLDGDITSKVVIDGTVDPDTSGVYTLNYTVTDRSGNSSTATRTVTVIYCSGTYLTDSPYANSSSGGNGGSVPFKICTQTQLAYIADNIATEKNYNFELTGNIDASTSGALNAGAGWLPIGNNVDIFSGHFNGNNYTVTGLTLNRAADNQGLFGQTFSSNINNLNLKDVNITGQERTGGVLGYGVFSFINNCTVSGTVNGTDYVGGLAGELMNGAITDSTNHSIINAGGAVGGILGWPTESVTLVGLVNTGTINSTDIYVGGIAGRTSDYTTIDRSYSSGDITSTGDYIGGIVGLHNAIIRNCFSTGIITGDDYVGGIIGSGPAGYAAIHSSYSTGDIIGDHHIGGIAGNIDNGIVMDVFSHGDITCNATCGGLQGGGLTPDRGYRLTDAAIESGLGTLEELLSNYYDPNKNLNMSWDTSIWTFSSTGLPQLN